jgi:hypothetical protein
MADVTMEERASLKMLTRSEILDAADLTRELVEVPEWGGALYVRAMTGTERDAFEESIIDVRQNGKGVSATPVLAAMRAKMCARCIVGEGGERLFTDSDIDALGAKSAAALDRVFAVAQRLNAMGQDDIEELAGN